MIDLEKFRRIKALKKDGYVQRSVAADVGVNLKTVQRWWNRSEDDFLGNGRTNRDDRLNVYKDFLVGELSRDRLLTDTVLYERLLKHAAANSMTVGSGVGCERIASLGEKIALGHSNRRIKETTPLVSGEVCSDSEGVNDETRVVLSKCLGLEESGDILGEETRSVLPVDGICTQGVLGGNGGIGTMSDDSGAVCNDISGGNGRTGRVAADKNGERNNNITLHNNSGGRSESTGSVGNKSLPSFNISVASFRRYMVLLRLEFGYPKPPLQVVHRKYAMRESPPGEESQVDMGQIVVRDMYGKSLRLYIFAMVLSCSRMKFFTVQSETFNARQFVEAHDLSFRYFGGRTQIIFYDQDRTMVVSENAGNIIYTKEFTEYKEHEGFDVYLCNKSDPSTKGKIENVIRYIKYNFFDRYEFCGMERLNSDILIWLDKVGNGKVHQTTLKVPKEEYQRERPLLTMYKNYEKKVIRERIATVDGLNTVRLNGNRYAMPKDKYIQGDKVRLEISEGVIKVFDIVTGEFVVKHAEMEGKGNYAALRKSNRTHEALVFETLELLDNTTDANVFLKRIQSEKPRYVRQQCSMIKKVCKTYDSMIIQSGITYCIERNLNCATELLSWLCSRESIEKAKDVIPRRTTPHYKERASQLSKYDSLMGGDYEGEE